MKGMCSAKWANSVLHIKGAAPGSRRTQDMESGREKCRQDFGLENGPPVGACEGLDGTQGTPRVPSLMLPVSRLIVLI